MFKASNARSSARRETCCRTCSIVLCSSKRIVAFFESSNRLESSSAAFINSFFSLSIWEKPFTQISFAFTFAFSKRVRAWLSLSVASLYRSSASLIVLKIVCLRLLNKLFNESRLNYQKFLRINNLFPNRTWIFQFIRLSRLVFHFNWACLC